MLTESMEELDSTVGGPMDVDDPREKVRSVGNSTLMVVGCVVSPITRRSRGGGVEGGVSVNDGEPESILLLVLEDDNALLLRAFDGLEVSRFHDPLMLDEDPLISFCRV